MIDYAKEIVNRINGYSCEKLGFMLTEFSLKETDIEIKVKPYNKEGELTKGLIAEELVVLVDRLYYRYSDTVHFVALSAHQTGLGEWVLSLKPIFVGAEESEESAD